RMATTPSLKASSRLRDMPRRITPAASRGVQTRRDGQRKYDVGQIVRTTVSRVGGAAMATTCAPFLDPTNVEVNVKVLNGCGINGYFWVYAAGSTDQQVALHVTDTRTGAQKVYSSPFGKKIVTGTAIQASPCVQTAAEP